MKEGFKRVPCKLVGEDGNAFAIMGRVIKALKRAGHHDLVEEYKKRATSGDYNNLLAVTMDYVCEPDEEEDEYED